MPAKYYAFLVRLWSEPAKQGVEWHSHVDHIQSGRRSSFDGLEQLLAFLRQQTEESTVVSRKEEPGSPED